MPETSEKSLGYIARGINKVGEFTGQFKAAAIENNKNIVKIIKDISTSFLSQKNEAKNLNNSISATTAQVQQTNSRINDTNNLLEHSIHIQNSTFQEMKSLHNDILNLISFFEKSGEGGLGSNIASSILRFGKKGLNGAAAVAGIGAGVALGSSDVRNSLMESFGLGGGKNSGNLEPSKQGAPGKSLAKNQAEAHAAAVGEGLSDRAARLFVANMTGESLSKPNDHHWDRHHMSQGIVQWDPARAEAIRKQFGKYPKDMSVTEQVKAAIWEMKNNKAYAKTWAALKNENLSDAEIMRIIVENYERPADVDKAVRQRLGHHEHLKNRKFNEQNEEQGNDNKNDAVKQPNNGGKKLSDFIDKTFTLGGGVTGNEHNLKNIKPELQSALIEALREYKEKTGKNARITSGHRTYEEQARVGATYGMKAKPGRSQHERGNAVDISEADAREMERLGILNKYGLHRPYGDRDPVHIEMSPGYVPYQSETDRLKNLEENRNKTRIEENNKYNSVPSTHQQNEVPFNGDVQKELMKVFGLNNQIIPTFMSNLFGNGQFKTPPEGPQRVAELIQNKSNIIPNNIIQYNSSVNQMTPVAQLVDNQKASFLSAELNNQAIEKESTQLAQEEILVNNTKKQLQNNKKQNDTSVHNISGYRSGEIGNTNDKNVMPDDGWPSLLLAKYA